MSKESPPPYTKESPDLWAEDLNDYLRGAKAGVRCGDRERHSAV